MMKQKKRWLGIMLSVVLVVGTLQVPVYAAETGETAAEAEVEEESVKSVDEPVGEEQEVDVKEEETVHEDDSEEATQTVEEDSVQGKEIAQKIEEAINESETGITNEGVDKKNDTVTIDITEKKPFNLEAIEDNTNSYGKENTSVEIEESLAIEGESKKTKTNDAVLIPEGASKYKGNLYYIFDDSLTWKEAKNACESRGGHLVTISDDEEFSFIKEMIRSNAGTNKFHFWAGGTDEDNEGTWTWVTGEKWEYTCWEPGQPNNADGNSTGDQDYLEIWHIPGNADIQWNDEPNDGYSEHSPEEPYYLSLPYYSYICEWDAISTPILDYIEIGIGGNVTVHWKAEGMEKDISGYRIRHRIEGTAEWRTTTVSNRSSSSVMLKNLAADDYEIEISSFMTVNGYEISSPYSEPARCPVPTIEIINPANGSLFADSYALKPIIDFNHWAENTGKGSLHVYDNNHKEILSQLLEKKSEEDTYRRLMTSCSEGYTWDESRASNPKGELKPNEFYHISIDEKAIQLLDEDEIEPYMIPVYFSGIKETDSTWKFKTVDLSYPGLINPKGLRIDEQYYHLLFDEDWERVIKNDDGTNGHCFGLAYTVGAYEYGFPCLKDLTAGYSKLSDVPICENSVLLKYVQVAHLLQAYKAYARYEKNDKVYKLYNSVKSGTNVILDLEASQGLHSVYSVGVIDDSDDSNIKIAVYDPNYPSIVASNGQDYRSFINTVTLSKGLTNTNWKLSYEASHIQYGLKGFHEIDSDYDPLIISNMNLSARDVSKAAITGISNKIYTGNAITQKPKVTIGSSLLELGSDYIISYNNNISVGKASITITGVGKYDGTITKTFLILPGKTTRGDLFNLANNVKVEWKEVPGARYYKVYRSGVIDPVIITSGLVGWDKAPGLENGKKYTYRIVASLTGKGDASGDSPLSYSKLMYRLKTVVIRSVKNTAPGKVTVKYDKTASGDSYVLQYSTNKDMTGAKTKVVLGANNTSYVIGGLKKGKTYYISIRVRKKVNGIDYYTTFGVPKKVTIIK